MSRIYWDTMLFIYLLEDNPSIRCEHGICWGGPVAGVILSSRAALH